MANQPIRSMELKTLIRLKVDGRSNKFISRSLGVSRTSVIKYVQLLEGSGLGWPALAMLDEAALLTLCNSGFCAQPDDRYAGLSSQLAHYTRELKRPHVTRQLLWEEYREAHPDGYGKTQFFAYLREHLRLQAAYAPVVHKAGEKLFVDYAGDHLHLTDPATGELVPVEVFIGVLGCSGLVYAEASRSQQLEAFALSVQNNLHYLGGVPACLVPDNLKSAVGRAHLYEPRLNERFQALAAHYGFAVVPARPVKPKDKPKVENGVRHIYRRIYARLRNEVFHTLEALNVAIRGELETLNTLPMQGHSESRRTLFEHIEREHLRPLPTMRWAWKHQRELTVQRNCHVFLSETKHWYSAPYRYIGRKVKLLYDLEHVEIFCQGERVALHPYSYQAHGYSSKPEHLPSQHRYVGAWSEAFFLRRARLVGPETEALFQALFRTKDHPEQAYRSCHGILALGQKHGHAALEGAAAAALERRQYHYHFIHTYLTQGRRTKVTPAILTIPASHDNVRGAAYYSDSTAVEARHDEPNLFTLNASRT
jgi:transposase